MLNDQKVLIIEADSEKTRELEAVLKFINYVPVVEQDCTHWQNAIDNPGDILAVIAGSCAAENALGELLTEIHQVDEHLPVYLLAERGKEPTVTIDAASCILGRKFMASHTGLPRRRNDPWTCSAVWSAAVVP
jgi:sigma-54 specific flagellar transcriptional regulator A